MSECRLCSYYEAQYHRAIAEALEARLDVVDGPRHRVNELERHIAAANEQIATLNGENSDLKRQLAIQRKKVS